MKLLRERDRKSGRVIEREAPIHSDIRVNCTPSSVFLKFFCPRPPFALKNFKGSPEEWVCVEKHPRSGGFNLNSKGVNFVCVIALKH